MEKAEKKGKCFCTKHALQVQRMMKEHTDSDNGDNEKDEMAFEYEAKPDGPNEVCYVLGGKKTTKKEGVAEGEEFQDASENNEGEEDGFDSNTSVDENFDFEHQEYHISEEFQDEDEDQESETKTDQADAEEEYCTC